ncbi:DUF992 domain-containing protein [Polycladidibacter hongkongensis]|uniref:DUF992 domain-containing protein n=1 Tax=Polycladidibacter hongkongensis TaxID=1647556 RepID=UPI000831A076|nr:DUF992 domain-containing protein [Pseudovibrio hongkongensis]
MKYLDLVFSGAAVLIIGGALSLPTGAMAQQKNSAQTQAKPATKATDMKTPASEPEKGGYGVKLGVLRCQITDAATFVVGSVDRMMCTFNNSTTGKDEQYSAKMTSVGLDIGPVTSGSMVWAVMSPSRDVAPGALAGGYGGLTAGVTVGAGVQANVLVGGSTKSIALQPISLQSQTGANLSAGISGMTLKKM